MSYIPPHFQERIREAKEKQLKELDLSNNWYSDEAKKLTEIPAEVFELEQLESLILSNNRLTTVPESLTNLVDLTQLILVSNQLTEIPESLTKLANLTELDLRYNQIKEIPEFLAKLANLTELYLGVNKITEIPESLTKLANLTTLDLWGNQLTEIPESLTKLANLTTLDLGLNKLTEIPESLTKLANLTQLYLGGNKLKEIPESLTKLANLNELDLRKNPLETPPREVADKGIEAIRSYFRQPIIVLREYGEKWNVWRQLNSNISIDFSGDDLCYLDLRGKDFSEVNLTRTQALATDFTGAILTGACIEDWNINSETKLDNVICDYIYLKESQQERRPSDPNKNFAPGEFTKLFQKALETVDLIFKDGIDWQAFLASFQKLQVECGSDELTIQSFENKGDGAFVIRVNVPRGADKAEIEKYLKRQYQLEAQLEAKNEQLANLMEITKLLAGRPNFYSNTQVEKVDFMSNNPGGISQSNPGSMGGGMQAAIGDNTQQVMSAQATPTDEQLTKDNVIQLIAELEEVIASSELPDKDKNSINTYLAPVKEELEEQKPDKELIQGSLENVTKKMNKLSQTLDAAKNLWDKAQPIISKIVPWLGAAGSFLGNLH